MTPEEIEVFLQSRHTISMASLLADGSVHLVAMWYGFVEGLICVSTNSKSQKVVNLRRDPRVTLLAEAGSTYDELQGVEIVGNAEIIDTASTRLRELCTSILTRNAPDTVDDLDAVVDQMLHNRVGVVIHPDRIVSWDHRKLAK